MLLCSVFVTIFANAEHRNGYDKNFGGIISHRGQLVISKIVAVAIEIMIAFILFAIAIMIAVKIFCGSHFVMGSFCNLFTLLVIQYLLHVGFACFIVFICVLTRSGVFAMVSGILISCNIMNVIYSLVNRIVHSISNKVDFDISHFMVDYNIFAYSLELSANDTTRVIAVGCIFIIISVVGASIVIEKRDVL